MKLSFDYLKKIKDIDTLNNNLTYIVPRISFRTYVKDELMWVKVANNDSITVFRCMDGALHSFDQKDLVNLKTVGVYGYR